MLKSLAFGELFDTRDQPQIDFVNLRNGVHTRLLPEYRRTV